VNAKFYANKRIKAFILQLKSLLTSEFPYKDSRSAVIDLFRDFNARLNKYNEWELDDIQPIDRFKTDLSKLYQYIHMAGFILRSTNVRNAFELYQPLLRMVLNILEPGIETHKRQTKLILSSEWNYIPYVIDRYDLLEDYVLIGLPSSESSNPLFLPIAGHEIGHSLWRKSLLSPLKPDLRKKIKFDIGSDEECWFFRQCEETFCDIVGYLLFGDSFLHSFAYLASPGTTRYRSGEYPTTLQRAKNLKALHKVDRFLDVPDYWDSLFEFEESPPKDSDINAIDTLSSIDQSVKNAIPLLIDEASERVKPEFFPIEPDKIDQIVRKFEKVIPPSDCGSLGNIICAGWKCYLNPDFWEDYGLDEDEKDRALKDLIIKTIEIFEVENMKADSK